MHSCWTVFVLDEGIVQFQPVRRLTREDVAAVVALIARRVECLVERRGLAGGAESRGPPDLWSEEVPVLASVAASVEGRVALGVPGGARVRRAATCLRRGCRMSSSNGDSRIASTAWNITNLANE
jgi:hypothetical protein